MVLTRSNVHFSLLALCNVFKFCTNVMEERIVGGGYSTPKRFPHAVFLDIYCNEEWVCGSSVLNQNMLLTAAHCLVGCDLNGKDKIRAIAGCEDYEGETAVVRRIDVILLHQHYEEDVVRHDIGLATLQTDLPLNEFIKRVIIPYTFPNAHKGIVAGWGLIEEEKELSTSRLKFVETELLPRSKCRVIEDVGPGVFCASSVDDTYAHPSFGDSGSALVIDGYQQIGLLSFRDLNSPPGDMVYTNVTYYYNWIMASSKDLFCKDLTRL